MFWQKPRKRCPLCGGPSESDAECSACVALVEVCYLTNHACWTLVSFTYQTARLRGLTGKALRGEVARLLLE